MGKGSEPLRKHYGSLIIVALCVAQVIVFFGTKSISIVLVDIKDTLGISVSQVGLIAALFIGTNNFGSLFWGGITDKLGPRRPMVAAGFIFSAACVLFGLFGPHSYFAAVIIWTIAGFGSSGLQEAVIPKVVNAWFYPSDRGNALRFIMPGGPVGSMILGIILPIGVSAFGWGPAFVLIGMMSALGTLLFNFVKNKPSDIGLKPVGTPPSAVEGAASEDEEPQLGIIGLYARAFKMKITWIMGLIALFYQFYFYANSTYAVSNVRSLGYSVGETGFMVTVLALTSILLMQFWGPLSDRVGRKKTMLIALVGTTLAPWITFAVSQGSPSLPVLYLTCGLTQCFVAIAPVFMGLLSDAFPSELNATCSGIVSAFSAAGSYLGSYITGVTIDALGGSMFYYCVPVSIGALLCFGAVLLLPGRKFLQEG